MKKVNGVTVKIQFLKKSDYSLKKSKHSKCLNNKISIIDFCNISRYNNYSILHQKLMEKLPQHIASMLQLFSTQLLPYYATVSQQQIYCSIFW